MYYQMLGNRADLSTAVLPFMPVVKSSGSCARACPNGCSLAATSESPDRSTAGCANTDSFGGSYVTLMPLRLDG